MEYYNTLKFHNIKRISNQARQGMILCKNGMILHDLNFLDRR